MKTKVNIFTNEKPSNVLSIYLEKSLDFEGSRMIIDKVVDFLTKDYIKNHGAEIISSVNMEQVVNMVKLQIVSEVAKIALEGNKNLTKKNK